MSLGYVTVCLVRDELDVKYYVNLWENELKRLGTSGHPLITPVGHHLLV